MSASLVIVRLRVPSAEASGFRGQASHALSGLAGMPGFVSAELGRNLDDPELWVLRLTFTGIGASRRALTGRGATIGFAPVWRYALDEPSTFEVLESAGQAVGDPPEGDVDTLDPRSPAANR